MRKLILLLLVFLFISCAGGQVQQDRLDQLTKDIEEATKSGSLWSSYGAMGSGNIVDSDDFLVRDISDTTLGALGTQKRYTWSNMKSDMSSFEVLEIPNEANPTVNEQGEFALDSTDYQLVFYGDEVYIVSYKNRECFTLENPADADDNVPVFSHEDGFTITDMRCWTEGGTSVTMYLSDGTNNLDSMVCDSDGTNDDGTIANSSFTADEQMEFDISTVSGVVTWVNFCFSYKITRE